MEVHAHSHTARKKWTHYFWEFIMLFLAVFAGFLAENQREHYVEHQREKQLIRSLYNDVKTDTANLATIIRARMVKEQAMDTVLHMMNSDFSADYANQIYYYAVPISRTLYYRFVSNDGTMLQLKNAGGLRLIRKRNVVDSISKYDLTVRNVSGQTAVEETLVDHYRTASSRIFDARIFDQMLDENGNIMYLPSGRPTFQDFSRRELYEWNYRLYSLKTINKGNRRDAKLLLQQATDLLITLKDNYRLE